MKCPISVPTVGLTVVWRIQQGCLVVGHFSFLGFHAFFGQLLGTISYSNTVDHIFIYTYIRIIYYICIYIYMYIIYIYGPHIYIYYHIISYHILSHHITSHHITSHHITSHHITSHHITSHHITSHHITSHHITSHHITSHHITSHHITSHHITSHHITSHHITSHHITYIYISYYDVRCHIAFLCQCIAVSRCQPRPGRGQDVLEESFPTASQWQYGRRIPGISHRNVLSVGHN